MDQEIKYNSRTTARKALIDQILREQYSGGPVLLEELRWKVLAQQYGPAFVEMTDAKQKSFARTIRDYFPIGRIRRIRIDANLPLGLIARAAVFRLKRRNELDAFLDGESPSILCRYRTNREVDEPRYHSGNRYVIPQYHAVTFRFFPKFPETASYDAVLCAPGTFIPATQKLLLITLPGSSPNTKSAAQVPWQLFGYQRLDQWYGVAPMDGLSSVTRNRG
jgi:hypothetical protein